MPRLFVLAFATLVTCAPGIGAQRADVSADPGERKPIFRLSVALVQLDAVVTDRRGRHVTTLGKDDFEIFQDGRSQPITAAVTIKMGEPQCSTAHRFGTSP